MYTVKAKCGVPSLEVETLSGTTNLYVDTIDYDD